MKVDEHISEIDFLGTRMKKMSSVLLAFNGLTTATVKLAFMRVTCSVVHKVLFISNLIQ